MPLGQLMPTIRLSYQLCGQTKHMQEAVLLLHRLHAGHPEPNQSGMPTFRGGRRCWGVGLGGRFSGRVVALGQRTSTDGGGNPQTPLMTPRFPAEVSKR